MGFVDEVTVYVRGGKGGAGSASLLREPYKPRGGPDGGDGGQGGSVILEVSGREQDLSTLADRPHRRAENGRAGSSNNRTGAAGEDLVIEIPDGTVVREGDDLVADLVGPGARAIVARGGRGGRGNAALAGPRERVPRVAETGEEGEERQLDLELRTVADVGLVGLPNAGKSTLLAALTAARPKIANYPFTTLTPNLGVAGEDRRFVIADIPGLIEGANEGKGLGHRFLRHIVRCRALLLVVDLSAADPRADLSTLRSELSAYEAELAGRPAIVVGTKIDLVADRGAALADLGDGPVIAVSSVSGEGMGELAAAVDRLAAQAADAAPERSSYVVLRPARPRFSVTREGERFRVAGRGVERWVAETDLQDPAQVVVLQRKLVKEGVERELASMGARWGDEVLIGTQTFEFIPEQA
jgi:GTP-binding protein